MTFNDLLQKQGIDPAHVYMFRHVPKEPKLKRHLPWLAEKRPGVFNAYQQTQGIAFEDAMLKRLGNQGLYVASFVAPEPGEAVFVGLYSVGEGKQLDKAKYWRNEHFRELHQAYNASEPKRYPVRVFDFQLLPTLGDRKGMLIVRPYPGRGHPFYQRAERNDYPYYVVRKSVLPDGLGDDQV